MHTARGGVKKKVLNNFTGKKMFNNWVKGGNDNIRSDTTQKKLNARIKKTQNDEDEV